MNTIVKSFSIFLFFIFLFLLLLPKVNLYYAVEKELKKYHIVVSHEKFINTKFGFNLEKASLYLKGINIASLDNVTVVLNSVEIVSQELGTVNGQLNIFSQSVNIQFKPTLIFLTKYRTLLQYLTKQKNGVYEYEYKLF